MKVLFLFLALPIAAMAAGDKEENPSFVNWQPIQVIRGNESGAMNSDVDDKYVCLHAKRSLLEELVEKPRVDYKFQCSAVVPNFGGTSARDGNWAFMRFPRTWTNYSYQITIMCQPRSLMEKQIIALARRCEKDPKPECYSAENLSYMAQVKETVFQGLDFNCTF